MACTAALTRATDGACEPVVAGTDPVPPSQCTAAPPCGNIGYCNGAGACAMVPANAPCGTATCINNMQEMSAGQCSGTGTCNPGTVTNCGNYFCFNPGCPTTCDTDNDCVPPASCQGGACL